MHLRHEASGRSNAYYIITRYYYMNKAFVAIHCEIGKESPVIRKLMEIKGVTEVMGTLGLYDIMIEVEASDSKELENIITKQVRKIPHVLTTMTLMVV